MKPAYEKAQEQFQRERQAYWALRDSLMKDYRGLWVAIVNGQVATSGKNRGRVGYEAYLKTGSEVCFCAQVGFEDRIFQIRHLTTGYFDIAYDPVLPKAMIPTGAFQENPSGDVDFLVDTGADITLLRSETVDHLGLLKLPGSSAMIRGLGGIPEERELYGAIVYLAGASIPIYVVSHNDVNENILGRDVINEFELTLCAKRNLVRFQWVDGNGTE